MAGEELTRNEKGESIIGYADYVIAMVDKAGTVSSFAGRVTATTRLRLNNLKRS